MAKATKATLRWITSPLNRANRFLLKDLNGLENKSTPFVTPYAVEKPGEEPIIVLTKYVFDRGELTEYYYEIEGPPYKIQDLCSRTREVAYAPLELTYVVPNPGKMVSADNLYGILPILKVLIRKELLGETTNPFGDVQIEKVVYNYFKNPAYITFTPIQRFILPTTYDVLDEYRAKLPNPLGTVADRFYFAPTDNGSEAVSPVYVNEARLADIRSKINIGELIGWTLLHPTPMPYHVLDEWCKVHDYLHETALTLMKRVGSEKDVVLIRNDLVHARPESIFWDLQSKAILREDRGWFIYKIPEVSLSENVEKVYDEIFRNFGFQKRTVREFPQEMCLNYDEKYRSAFGFDVKEWLGETKTNIFNELPPALRLEGEWMNNDDLPLTSENLARVTYAAYRAYGELMQNSIDYTQFTDMIVALPDFSISLPIYNLDDLNNAKDVVSGILENPEDVKAVICKDLPDCIAAREETAKGDRESVPLIMDINGNVVLASDSSISIVKKPGDFPKEAWEKDLDPLDPRVQGFLDLGKIKGIVDVEKIKKFKMPKPRVRILEFGNNITVNVEIDDTYDYDLFTIPIPKKAGRRQYIREIEDLVGELWSQGWFLTNWGRSLYRSTGKLSTHLIKDIQSEIKTLEDLRLASEPPIS